MTDLRSSLEESARQTAPPPGAEARAETKSIALLNEHRAKKRRAEWSSAGELAGAKRQAGPKCMDAKNSWAVTKSDFLNISDTVELPAQVCIEGEWAGSFRRQLNGQRLAVKIDAGRRGLPSIRLVLRSAKDGKAFEAQRPETYREATFAWQPGTTVEDVFSTKDFDFRSVAGDEVPPTVSKRLTGMLGKKCSERHCVDGDLMQPKGSLWKWRPSVEIA